MSNPTTTLTCVRKRTMAAGRGHGGGAKLRELIDLGYAGCGHFRDRRRDGSVEPVG